MRSNVDGGEKERGAKKSRDIWKLEKSVLPLAYLL